MERRKLLKLTVLGAGAAAAAAPAAAAATQRTVPDDAVGMLYDSTRCIGCKACVVACREANGLAPEANAADGGRHDMQQELNGNTKNVIKLYRDAERPGVFAFMKQQCMHCVDPTCASVCMLGALHKGEKGIVTYDPDGCIGCRYCQIACPFNVPKFEWGKAQPKIVKCEMCKHLITKGQQPACCQVCPREAVIYGKREQLLNEARRRITAAPRKYLDRIYGEKELGGTQVLYLTSAAVPFAKLGLPEIGTHSPAWISESLQHGIYQGFATPAVLFAGLTAAVLKNWKRGGHDRAARAEAEQKKEEKP